MKKLFIILQLILFMIFCFFKTDDGFSQMNSVNENQKSEQVNNYLPGRHVIASGGVMGAFNGTYSHSATIGQSFVGGMEGANYFHLIGYWQPGLIWTEIEQDEYGQVPTNFSLYQNYPNPFNPQTTIYYDLPEQCSVTIEVFNVKGQRINLLGPVLQGPGRSQIMWHGRDDFGRLMGSGIYIYQVIATEEKDASDVLFHQTKKMLLVK